MTDFIDEKLREQRIDIDEFESFANRYVASSKSKVGSTFQFGSVSNAAIVSDKKAQGPVISGRMDFGLGKVGDVRRTRIPKPESLDRSRSTLIVVPGNEVGDKRKPSLIYRSDRIPLSTYRSMAHDTSLSLGTSLISSVISSMSYTVRMSNKRDTAIVQNIYGKHHRRLIDQIITNSFRDGFVFGQKVWENRTTTIRMGRGEEAKTITKDITDLHDVRMIDPLGSTQYYRTPMGEVAYVQQYQRGANVKVSRNKLLWFSLDKTFGNIFGNSAYKRAYPYWHYGKPVFQYAVRHLEKMGSPHLEGRYPRGEVRVGYGSNTRTVMNRDVMQAMIEALKSTGGVAIPSDTDEKGNPLWSLEYKHPPGDGADNYVKFLEFLDQKKFEAIWIPKLIFGDSSYAESDASIQMLMLIIEKIVNQVEDVLRQDIIEYIVAYNFGKNRVDELQFSIERGSLGRRKILKEILSDYIRVAASAQGWRPKDMPDMQGIIRELGAGVVDWEDTVVEDEVSKRREEQQNKAAEKKADLVSQQQSNEDSNGRHRKKGRPQGPRRRSEDKPAGEAK